jgi:hypothetical protein
MKIAKAKMQQIIKEEITRALVAEVSHDEWYDDRHAADQEDMDYYLSAALETAVKDNPGADGKTVLDLVRVDPIFQGTTDKQIWDMADTMIEDDTLFFDTEEDAWYYAPEMR